MRPPQRPIKKPDGETVFMAGYRTGGKQLMPFPTAPFLLFSLLPNTHTMCAHKSNSIPGLKYSLTSSFSGTPNLLAQWFSRSTPSKKNHIRMWTSPPQITSRPTDFLLLLPHFRLNVFWCSSELPANAGDRRDTDADSIPGLGRSPGKGNGSPLQYSCLENSMDRWA